MLKKHNAAWVLITGSSSGIGLCLVEKFLDLGYRVIATCHRAAHIQSQLRSDLFHSPRLQIEELDVTDELAWQELLDKLRVKGQDIGILINNAGVLYADYVAEAQWSQIEAQVKVNSLGVMLGCHKLAPLMVKQGFGHIINVGSLAGIAPVPGMAAYCASKFAVRGFSVALAMELRASHVYVSVVELDACATPMLHKAEKKAAAALLFSGNRILTPEEVAETIVGPVLQKRAPEYLLPLSRGYVAKTMALFPELAVACEPIFHRWGDRQQRLRETKAKARHAST